MRVVGAFLGAALAAAVLVTTAGSATNRHTTLSGCVYVTNKGLSSVLNLVIADPTAPRAKGTVELTGAGLSEKSNFVLSPSGTGRVPFVVTVFNAYRFAVDLTKPKLDYQVAFTMNPVNDVTTSGCTPK